MEAKHTPGPWWADEDGCVAAGNGTDDTYETVADVFYNEANAALIAAAPDMYEAIRAYFDDLDNPSADLTTVRNAMSAALAKAEGRSENERIIDEINGMLMG